MKKQVEIPGKPGNSHFSGSIRLIFRYKSYNGEKVFHIVLLFHQKKTLSARQTGSFLACLLHQRNGGYTRIVRTGVRRGDAAETAIIELVK